MGETKRENIISSEGIKRKKKTRDVERERYRRREKEQYRRERKIQIGGREREKE